MSLINEKWFKVAENGKIEEGGRIHVNVDGRFITLFRYNGKLSAIDSICHHAGGPLTLGPIKDIEELGMRVVLCPWHNFMVNIENGVKAYQGVEIVNGKPTIAGWKTGKVVQRCHKVCEKPSGIYVSIHVTSDECMSDKDSHSENCAQNYPIYAKTSTPIELPIDDI